MQHTKESIVAGMTIVEADKIGSVVSGLALQRQLAVVGERRRARVGDAVVVRALTDSATYNQLELPSGRLAKINPGDVVVGALGRRRARSEEHTSELQSLAYLVCRLLLEKKI